MRRYLKFWYKKWIKGECRHFCHRCKYGENCFFFYED